MKKRGLCKFKGKLILLLTPLLCLRLFAYECELRGGYDKYIDICNTIENKLYISRDTYIDKFPGIEANTEDYVAEENDAWSSAFYIGMLYLAYERTGNGYYIEHIGNYLDSFEDRLSNTENITHDLGFLYTLSCVSLYKKTGNQRARDIALEAADRLALRFHDKGRFIQAWGKPQEGTANVDIIVDTMMNLPLLYWAAEETGKQEYAEIASAHADTCKRYLVRDDYSSYHAFFMNLESGEAVRGHTYQGFHDETTWARGEAWIIYGFALAYKYTGNIAYISVAKGAADFFIQNLPDDYVTYWDFTFNDDVPDIKDTSATAIAVSGILELCDFIDDEEKKCFYYETVLKMIENLYKDYFIENVQRSCILKDGMFHREDGNTFTIWGDYFFYESLIKLCDKDFTSFW